MKCPCTGVILAGGLNTRFSGKEKAFIQVGDKRIIDGIYDIYKDIFEEIILVTNNPVKFLDLDVTIVRDIFSVRSSLTGIHAGLFYSTNPYSFITACDTPFLRKELINAILKRIDRKISVVIPETAAGIEPLCALYSKKCLPVIEDKLDQEKLKIIRFFEKVRIKKIPEDELRKYDPDLISFFNINTPGDLDKANNIFKGLGKPFKKGEYK